MNIIISQRSAVQTINDQLKTNTALQMKDAGVEFKKI
jgi:hypothetical protein